VLSRFGRDSVVAQYEALYRSVLARARRTPCSS
jgi:hypothetical protein